MFQAQLTHLDCGVGSGACGETGNAIGEHRVGREADQTLQKGAYVR